MSNIIPIPTADTSVLDEPLFDASIEGCEDTAAACLDFFGSAELYRSFTAYRLERLAAMLRNEKLPMPLWAVALLDLAAEETLKPHS